jgi:phospholipid/cholesterol/gamma-HCH transport system permease protein
VILIAAETLGIRRFVGRWSVNAASHVGRVAYLVLDLVRGLREWRIWLPRMMTEAWNIGVGSLFIVLLISGFAGAVTSLQARYQFTGTIPIYYLAGVIVESIVLELGPVLTGLILAGRIGARYAAELGTRRVTEQLDALESLGRSPSSHLLIPRVIAGLLMIPALTVLADVMGIASGWFSMKLVLPITDSDFSYGARIFWRNQDAYFSVIKSFFFAGSITVISCYMGFTTQQGAEGVGRSTTGAVVSSSVMILLLDVILTKLLLNQ